MMITTFVHLHLHTEFSLVDGLIRIKPLIKQVTEAGMPAVAVTDMNNMFAAIKFYKAARAAGIKPIIGAELWVQREAAEPARLVLLCQTLDGYHNLARLISRGYREGQQRGVPILAFDWLKGSTEGLIALSGGREGELGRALLHGHSGQAHGLLADWRTLFPDRFYLELQRTGRPEEEDYIQAAVELAAATDMPVVASNDVRFLEQKEFEAHEARVCIQEGCILSDPRRPRRYSEQQYLRTPAEMAELFADLPEALENSVEIAIRCNLEIPLGKSFLPDFPIPAGMSMEAYFSAQARAGLERRLQKVLDPAAAGFAERRRPYDERLEQELAVIAQMGFAGYFLIVADFIEWARAHQVPVGPGRGSGAGSLVAYALGITDLDPLAYDLLFERFLNPERVSMPDFDIDFCMEGRDRVIEYVAERYGRERVSQIATHGTMAAKAVIRDVGRVLGYPYGFVDRIAKMIPFELGITLDKALAQDQEFRKAYSQEEDVKTLVDLARSLEGLARNVGKHAGGVVIAPSELTDFSPLYCEEGATQGLVTQYDKDDVESVGLVKFDFLGLRTLTIIDWALQTINQQHAAHGEEPLDIATISLDDSETFNLLKACKTTAVFQLESRGMKDLIKRLQPDRFEDIVALVALFRPGPLQSGMVDDFIDRKHGRAKVEYPHPDLERVLKPTYGVILYQEQVMQIARVLANYTLGSADLLRRAMGKKKPQEMAKQRTVFTEGAAKRGVDPGLATHIFDLMEKFAGYGFNKTIAKGTQIVTLEKIKPIEDCRPNDYVLTISSNGDFIPSKVVQLHDHGEVPIWEIVFDDGIIERCTLDHKWLTKYGQLPLWEIIHLGEQVWGTAAYQTNDTCPSKTMSDLPQYDSYRSNFRQTKDHVLRYGCLYSEENIGTFANLPPVSAGTQADPYRYLQELKAYSRNEEPILRKGEENCGAIGYPTAACCETQELAGQQSRKILGESCQSACCFEAIEDGNLARTSSGRARIYQEYEIPLWRSKKASGFYPSALEDHNRSRWTMAFFTDQVFSRFSRCTRARSDVRERDHEKILAFNPSIDGVFQKLLWRAYLSQPGSVIREDQRYRLGRDIVLRKPVRITFLGWCQGYDLEIDHPDHNFILASGLCCSNSHSAAYALLSYQTAWLKTHYAAAFMAAVLSSDMDKTDKVVVFMEEARSMKLTILPPAINRSEYRFTVDDQGRIIYGLGAVKGVGEAAVEAIVEERRHTGPFQDLFDLCRRVDQHKLNRRVLESLIRAGAFDGLAPNRATLMAQLPEAMRLAEQNSRADDAGQVDLFGLPTVAEPVAVASDVGVVAEWDQEQLLKGEKETLGLYLTSHPIERLKPELEHIVTHPLVDLVNDSNGLASFVRRAGRNGDKPVIIAGLVVSVRTRTANRGGRMAFVMLDDNTARLEIRVFPEAYEQSRKLLIEDAILVIQGKLVWDDFAEGLRVNVDRVLDIDTARQEYARTLVLSLDAGRFNNGLLEHLAATLAPHRQGKCQIQVDYTRTDARASIVLGQDWRVKPSEALLRELRGLVGEEKVRVVYS